MDVKNNDKAIGIWLMVVAILVLLMIVVGGATRLTESGLSMVKWHPISGIMPPMDAGEWRAEFNAYKQFPEYIEVNAGMSLSEFKAIFWWEYGHRLLGRLIGLAFALPLLFFMARKMVRDELKMKLFMLLALGAAQGGMGWYMVTSGLVDEPQVSHFRLSAHLSLALVIFMALLGQGLMLLRPKTTLSKDGLSPLEFQVRGMMRTRGLNKLKPYIYIFIGLAFIQSVFGALVAGLDAGFAYNTWPLMDGAFIPAHAYTAPYLHNILNDPTSVQLTHRMLAYVLTLLTIVIIIRMLSANSSYSKPVKSAVFGMVALVFMQVGLGIATLISGVHIPLAVLHQGGAVLVLGAGIYVISSMWREQA